ncbi:serine hydrolase domain-containing protein [Nocardia sp. NBC_00403]|uniref:serine hydrolase domain-containing protein n=1 Tax=Nocardia sp. NBC_00403 TaxID=2975990 RepID=UPI002E1F1400
MRALGAASVSALLLVAGCGGAKPDRAATFPEDLVRTIDRIVQADIDAGLIPGAAVAIVDPERGTFSRAYGFADIGTGRKAEVRDHYRIGSITKTFAATAVLRLADDGKLLLDDRLSNYVDGIPNGDTITLHDLLGMRGGVYDFGVDAEFAPQLLAAVPDREWTTDDTLRVIRTHPDKTQPPNIRTSYSNSEFFLLGLVLERATGRPLRDVINDLARDYGLPDTVYPSDGALSAPDSRGYAYNADVRTDVTVRTPPSIWGAAGSMTSTVTDLAAYAPMLVQGQFLRPETLRARTAFISGTAFGAPMSYGLGLMPLGSWLGHTGSVLGYTAVTMYLPDRKVSVAVVANQYEPSYGSLLPISAASIWQDVVARLYPGTVPRLDAPSRSPAPPVPSPAELTDQLRNALDPTVPAADKLRAMGDDKDPELITKIARAYVGVAVTVDKTTDHGDGVMYATTRAAIPQKTVPMIIGFEAVDGSWRLDSVWSCQQLAVAGEKSPACP